MQLTGDIEWRDHEPKGTKSLDRRAELATFSNNHPHRTPIDSRATPFPPEREMYYDMDVALPLHWESMTSKGHKLSKSTDSLHEFEFSMPGMAPEPVEKEISPADDLFYKGQLLPLLLPKRLQMVQKLSSPKQQAEKGSSVTVSCFFQSSSLKHSALVADDNCLSSALVNSRSSSFHSQGSNNFWEPDSDSPGDVDSGESTSSRDSSDSSQDAGLPEKPSEASLKDHISDCNSMDRSLYQQREFFSSNNLRLEKSGFSSWLRTPFKWKVLLGGLKKAAKSKGVKAEEHTESSTSTSTSWKEHTRNFHAGRASSCSTRRQSPNELPDSGLFPFPSSSRSSRDRERSLSVSRARESLNKYLSILNPLSSKVPQLPRSDPSDLNPKMVDIRAATFPGDLTASPKHPSFSAGLPSPKATLVKSMSSPKRSFDKRSPALLSLSGNLRVPSFSRNSRASISASNAVAKVAASPHHSGVLPLSSPSAMTELHSAVQGAIAHCKQSQAKP